MSLPPEHLRPHKAVAGLNGQPPRRVPLSNDEWKQRLKDEEEWRVKMDELAKTQYLRDRESAYKQEVYPFLEEAMAARELDGNGALMEELKVKRKAIKERFPKPSE